MAGTDETVDLLGMAPPAEWGVTVDSDAISALASSWAGSTFELPDFSYPGTPANRDEAWWFDYVTLAVSVLACLWPPEGDQVWHSECDGDWLDDAPGIFAAFTRLIGPEGIDLSAVATLSDDDGAAIFVGRGTLQFIPERVATFRNVAATIQDRWDGTARHLVEEARRDGQQMAALLTETMPGYDDRPVTSAGIANFDKLSYLASAIMAAGVGWEAAGFHGFDDVPVYPDYMLPRVFRHHGAITYSSELATIVDKRQIVPKDSDWEHAIRWATVYCGAELTRSLAELGTVVTGPALDYRLWSIAVLGPDAALFGEHHRTPTLNY